jgi:hypothetical protein
VRSAAALLLGALVVVSTSARAGEPAPRDSRAVDAAQQMFGQGMRQAQAGDYEGARISFSESYGAWPSIGTLRNLAVAELETGHVADASMHLRQYARSKNADATFMRDEFPKLMARCGARLGHIHVTVPSGVIIAVDGHRIDPTETIDVEPGVHTVAAHGATEDTRQVSVAVRETVDVPFSVAPSSAAPPTSSTQSPLVPPAPMRASSDNHHLERASTNEGFWTTPHIAAVVLGAAALTGAGVALGAKLAANGKESTANQLAASNGPYGCASGGGGTECAAQHSAVDAQRTDSTVAGIALASAGALAVSAAVVFFLPPSARSQTTGLWVSPFGAGAALGGRF